INEYAVRLRPPPDSMRYETWFAPDFETGREIVRSLAQHDCLADITRLSDEEETRFFLGLSVAEGTGRRRALDAYLKLRGKQGGCMMIFGWEGERESVRRRRSLTTRMLREGGAVALGQSAG